MDDPHSCIDPALRSMVAFDIETTGLDPSECRITAAAVHDGRGLSKIFLFKTDEEERDPLAREEFLAILDSAPRLCAFNGVRFDLPFMAKRWDISPEVIGRWVLKTLDVYEACKLGLRQTFRLSQLLSVNGLESKTGDGASAIQLAKKGLWDELGAYCLQDTRMTYLATAQLSVALPMHTASGRRLGMNRLKPGLFCVW